MNQNDSILLNIGSSVNQKKFWDKLENSLSIVKSEENVKIIRYLFINNWYKNRETLIKDLSEIANFTQSKTLEFIKILRTYDIVKFDQQKALNYIVYSDWNLNENEFIEYIEPINEIINWLKNEN